MDNKKTLWTNGVWTITDYGRERSVMIDNHSSNTLAWHIDYAIIYDSGNVAYENNPYVLPQYVKDKVEKLLRKKQRAASE